MQPLPVTTKPPVIAKRICGTRALKNARAIQKIAPNIIPAQEPLEGFSSVLPFDVLQRFHKMADAELAAVHADLPAVKKQLQPPPAKLQPFSLFGDPPFKGTIYFVRLLFDLISSGGAVNVSAADMKTAIQYATMAVRPISAYSTQYGPNSLTVAPDEIDLVVPMTTTKFNDDTVRHWVYLVLGQKLLNHDSTCLVFLNPPGMINTDGDLSQGILGYHDEGDCPYCFVNVLGPNLTIDDRLDLYADTLSHEIAEMTCDPDASFFNQEVCDACAGNCNNSWRNFFVEPAPSLANSYIQSTKTFPPPFAYTYFIASVASQGHAGDCPAAGGACGYPPPIHAGRSELMFYDRGNGVGEFYSVDGQAEMSIQINHSDFRRDWSIIIPGNFTPKQNPQASSILFYDGQGEFYNSDGQGHISLAGATHNDWQRVWTHIIPGNFSGGAFSDLLFYNRAGGYGEFWHTDGKGGISRLGQQHSGWRTSWMVIIPGKFSDSPYTDLLFYDQAAGTGEFYRTDGKGNISLIKSNTNWRKTWAMIIPGKFSNGKYTDLLFYEPSSGTGDFWVTDGKGDVARIGGATDWRHDWTMIVPGNFSGGPYTDLLFYEASTGTGEFWKTDGRGNVSLIRGYNGWRSTWTSIFQL